MAADRGAVVMPRIGFPAAIAAESLGRYLIRQRWAGAKGRRLESVRVEDAIGAGGASPDAAILIVDARFADGTVRYQMPVIAGESRDVPDGIAAEDGRTLVDATRSPRFRAAFGEALAGGQEWRGSAWRWRAEPEPGSELLDALRAGESEVGTAEQSNTSLRYAGRAIAKIFRRVECGTHPDGEIAGALTRAGFPHVPAVAARAHLVTAEAPAADAALVQRMVPGARDAWSHALAVGREGFAAPPDAAIAATYPDEARRIGEVTRALHDALAAIDAPDFGAEPAAAGDLDRWVASATRSVADGIARLEDALRRGTVPRARVADAAAIARRGDAYTAHARRLADRARGDAGAMIRHHGDYHLGQLLRDEAGALFVIDFEGEPSRPLAERRARHSPLRDVAGMLRSFAYAAATLLAEVEHALPAPVREQRAARWERDARVAFLGGYGLERRVPVLPRRSEAAESLLGLFELEKAFYELVYELDNRPEWSWIPMRGISKLLVAR